MTREKHLLDNYSIYFYHLIVYFIIVLLPMYSGWIIIGDDTSQADIPFRKYSSFLATFGDTPHWLPHNGNGIDYSTIYWVAWSEVSLSRVLSTIFGWSLKTFALEHTIWSLIGFLGVYFLSSQILTTNRQSILVSFSFVCSGVIKWSSLSYVCFIAEMILPWLFFVARLLLEARTLCNRLTYSVLLSLLFCIIIRNGYPGLWVTSPFFVLLYLVFFGIWRGRGLRSFVVDLLLTCFLIFLLTSDILYNSMESNVLSTPYITRVDADLTDGTLRAGDLFSLFIPAALTEYNNHNIYFGILIPTVIPTVMLFLTRTLFLLLGRLMLRIIVIQRIVTFICIITFLYAQASISIFNNIEQKFMLLLIPILQVYILWSARKLSGDRLFLDDVMYIFRWKQTKLLFMSSIFILISSNHFIGEFFRHYVFPFSHTRYHNLFNGINLVFVTCFCLVFLDEFFRTRRIFSVKSWLGWTLFLYVIISYGYVKFGAYKDFPDVETFLANNVFKVSNVYLFLGCLSFLFFITTCYVIVSGKRILFFSLSLISIGFIVTYPLFRFQTDLFDTDSALSYDWFLFLNVLFNIGCISTLVYVMRVSNRSRRNLLFNTIIVFNSIVNFHTLYFQDSKFPTFPDVQQFDRLTYIYDFSHPKAPNNIKATPYDIIPKPGHPLLGNPALLRIKSEALGNYWFFFNIDLSNIEDNCGQFTNHAEVTDVWPSYIRAIIHKNISCDKLFVTFNDADHAAWNLYVNGVKFKKDVTPDLVRNFTLIGDANYYIIEWKYDDYYSRMLEIIVVTCFGVLSILVLIFLSYRYLRIRRELGVGLARMH